MRYTECKGEYFEMWFADKKSMLATMHRNMAADVEAGYNPAGQAIRKQLSDIEEYTRQMNSELDTFKMMDEMQVDKWCFYDMKKRGVIE